MASLNQQFRRLAAQNRVPDPFTGVRPATPFTAYQVSRHPPWWGLALRAVRKAHPQVNRRGRLEAVLFLSREPLPIRKLAHLANLADATEARTLLNAVRDGLERRGSAFQVAEVAGGFQLLSRPEFAPWLRARATSEEPVRLSAPALETLAVVAYRQPVLRAEVEAIRGVACGELLRQLMDRDLLRIVGRAEELGRPLSYGTTRRFLRVFGLRSLNDLPWAAELRRSADQEPATAPFASPDADTGLTTDVDAA